MTDDAFREVLEIRSQIKQHQAKEKRTAQLVRRYVTKALAEREEQQQAQKKSAGTSSSNSSDDGLQHDSRATQGNPVMSGIAPLAGGAGMFQVTVGSVESIGSSDSGLTADVSLRPRSSSASPSFGSGDD